MGHAYATLKLSNPRRPDLGTIEVTALADTGAAFTSLPRELVGELALEEDEVPRKLILANGDHVTVPYVGPLRLLFGNRGCYSGALVMGDKPLLGVVQMEDMDLLIEPLKNRVIANPESPDRISGSI